MMAAPTAAKAMTIAMTCRWRDDRSSRHASALLTPFASPVLLASDLPAPGSRRMSNVTVIVHTASVLALTSSIVLAPTRSTMVEVVVAPANPPRLDPAPMNPKMRFA